MMKKLGLLLALASGLFAHTGAHDGGFISGLLHPIGGLDHILAMVGVGMVAYFAGQKGFMAIGSFMFAMIVAAILGFSGLTLIGMEQGFLLSIAAVFLLVGFASKIPTYFIAAIVGFFGFFHGFAHGAEFASGSFVSYIAGFSVATFTLHMIGLFLAYLYSSRVAQVKA
jgi:urease accessory protein